MRKKELQLNEIILKEEHDEESYAGDHAKQAKDNRCLDTGRGVADWWLRRSWPLIRQVAEADEEHERPEEMEAHVGQHVVFPGLDRGHLLEQVLADQESDGRHKSDNTDWKKRLAIKRDINYVLWFGLTSNAEIACVRIFIVQAVALLGGRNRISLGGDAGKHHDWDDLLDRMRDISRR